MLFDLRSPRRRRVVQVVFGGLAVLFAVSFVFFGIGSEVGGGFADVLGQGGGDTGQEDAIEDAEDALETNPNDVQALGELVQAHYQAGNASLELDEETQQTVLTSDAEEQYVKAVDAWDRYVKAAKGQINTSVALAAVQNFGALATGQLTAAATASGQQALDAADDSLANWKGAAAAQALIVEKEGDAEAFRRLAEYYFFAGEFGKGDEAARQALAAAKGDEAKELQKALDAAESQSRQINDAIEKYRAQLEKATPTGGGAPGGATGENPLSEIGGGGLSGGGALGGP
jgi:hypothetical protein